MGGEGGGKGEVGRVDKIGFVVFGGVFYAGRPSRGAGGRKGGRGRLERRAGGGGSGGQER